MGDGIYQQVAGQRSVLREASSWCVTQRDTAIDPHPHPWYAAEEAILYSRECCVFAVEPASRIPYSYTLLSLRCTLLLVM